MKGGTRKRGSTWSCYFHMGIRVIDKKVNGRKRRIFSENPRGGGSH